MNPDLNTVLNAAMKLPPDQRATLIEKLSVSPARSKEHGLVRRHFGMIDSGDPNSANNDKIDEDLTKSYLDNHNTET